MTAVSIIFRYLHLGGWFRGSPGNTFHPPENSRCSSLALRRNRHSTLDSSLRLRHSEVKNY